MLEVEGALRGVYSPLVSYLKGMLEMPCECELRLTDSLFSSEMRGGWAGGHPRHLKSVLSYYARLIEALVEPWGPAGLLYAVEDVRSWSARKSLLDARQRTGVAMRRCTDSPRLASVLWTGRGCCWGSTSLRESNPALKGSRGSTPTDNEDVGVL